MTLFTGTASYYRQFRPGIPTEVADLLAAAAPARHPRRLLDIGTGTGLVAEALLTEFDDIVAIDNDPDMIEAAEAALRPSLPDGAQLLLAQCTAEQFTPAAGWLADLVTICRAFHWLDQEAVLAQLEHQTAPDGAVAIFGDNSFWNIKEAWMLDLRDLIKTFLGEQRRAGAGTFNHHNRPYSEILQESPFNRVEEHTIPVHRTWNADAILGYLYSTSFASRDLFGGRLKQFDAAARAVLATHSENDTFGEDNEFLVRIGRRSTA